MIKLKKITACFLSIALCGTMAISAVVQSSALDNWSTIRTDFKQVMLAPGSDESQLNFAWYSAEESTPYVQIVPADRSFDDAEAFSGTSTKAYNDTVASVQYYSNKVTATGLSTSGSYKYRYKVGEDSQWSEEFTYEKQDTKDGFCFIAVGDPQIGIGNGGSEADTERWLNTLSLATETAPDASFIYSMGDQVDSNQEYDQYAGFMYPSILRSLPIATTNGNHDCDVPNISWHFNNPNMTNYGETSAGGDYYFSYGDVLFININANAVLKSSKSSNAIAVEHRKAIEEAIASNPYAKWRIVTMHQDLYGYPDHYDDAEVKRCREQLYPIIDDYDIDVVLTGHGHNFTRSYQMENNVAVNTETSGKSAVTFDPSGTVYFELSTAASKNYENNKPGSKAHIANSFAVNGVQSFSTVDIESGSITIDTYRTDTMEVYDSYTINKKDRTKLDKSIEQAESIINSGKYTDDELAEIKEAVEVAKSVPADCNLVTAYDAAVALDAVIKSFDPILYGDVNGDGDVYINDCILLRKHIAKIKTLDSEQQKAADVTHDGGITLEDVLKIQKYLAYIITTLD